MCIPKYPVQVKTCFSKQLFLTRQLIINAYLPYIKLYSFSKKDLFNYLLKFREINEQLPLGGFIFPVRPAQRQMWELTDWGGRQVEATHTQSCRVATCCETFILRVKIQLGQQFMYVNAHVQHVRTCVFVCLMKSNRVNTLHVHSKKKKLSSNAITDYDFPNNLMQLGRQERRARSALLS